MTPIIVDLSFSLERARSALQQQASSKKLEKIWVPSDVYKYKQTTTRAERGKGKNNTQS